MIMSLDSLTRAIEQHEAKFIDLRFTDMVGIEHHVSVPVGAIEPDLFTEGKMFDGSSIDGWQKINASDLALVPDITTLMLDPFFQDSTLALRCLVRDPLTQLDYEYDPRVIARRAEVYLVNTGIADQVFFGPEPEFFLFDDVRWNITMQGASYAIRAEEGQWNSGKAVEGGNIGHRPRVKGGYCAVPPVDSSHDVRAAIAMTMESLGVIVEAHHHEVATANQCEVATRFNTLTRKADELQLLKYVVRNIAHNHGKTATFMPKPLVGENGSGMHCHQSLMKAGVNLFAGDAYAGLSETALYYIGGIMKHARSLNAFTNPAVNSYKRLVPGFEAPVLLAYAARNRSAAVRIPASSARARRIEVRFPDGMANPYLAFTAMLMAGLDGIQRKIDPGVAREDDLYQRQDPNEPPIATVAQSLEQAVASLQEDHDYLLQGDVFTPSYLERYIALREHDITTLRCLVHPAEFELYYSL